MWTVVSVKLEHEDGAQAATVVAVLIVRRNGTHNVVGNNTAWYLVLMSAPKRNGGRLFY